MPDMAQVIIMNIPGGTATDIYKILDTAKSMFPTPDIVIAQVVTTPQGAPPNFPSTGTTAPPNSPPGTPADSVFESDISDVD